MHKKLIATLIGLILFFGGGTVWAAVETTAKEAGKATATPVLTNIGFMKNPPKEMKEKFPMCDAFLNVEWIDKEKKIGYSRYDLYQDGKKKGQMMALIYLNQYYPHFDYDLNKYRSKGKLETIFSFIRKGKIVGKDELLTIRIEGKELTFWPTIPIIPVEATLLDNHQNVCIPYPDGQRMWIVEGRRVGKVFTDQQIEERYGKIQKYFPDIQIMRFKEMNVINLNYDGADDYYRKDGWLVYSYSDRYFERIRTKVWYEYPAGESYYYSKWNFTHSNITCELKLKTTASYYLTTDGKNYFFSNQCNLTELTKGGEYHE